jgi:hypothetical protein
VLPETVHKARDPRFDGVSGAVDLGLVQHAYGFVDEARAVELKELEETLRQTQEQGTRDAIADRIRLLRDQERVGREEKRKEWSDLLFLGVGAEAAGPRAGGARQGT